MASILDILNTPKGKELVNILENRTSKTEERITLGLSMIMPIILGILKQNLSSADVLNKFDEALNAEKYRSQNTEDLELKYAFQFNERTDEILCNTFYSSHEQIISFVSGVLNMDKNTVSELFDHAAGLILKILATVKEKNKIDGAGIDNFLNTALGYSSQYENSLIEILVSSNEDARIIEDINGMILGGGNKDKGGSILGGMLGGK